MNTNEMLQFSDSEYEILNSAIKQARNEIKIKRILRQKFEENGIVSTDNEAVIHEIVEIIKKIELENPDLDTVDQAKLIVEDMKKILIVEPVDE